MTKYFNVAVVAATVLMASCAGNNGPEVDKSIMPAADSTKAAASQAAPQTIQAMPDPSAAGSKTVAVPSQTPTAAPAPATGPGLNPAHGEPGHRCDIAVGAPLNSAPAAAPAVKTTSTPAVSTTPVVTPATPAAAPTVTAPGMNPPHGQPGHDCSIAVGAPLKKG